jgi:hypothetical protein
MCCTVLPALIVELIYTVASERRTRGRRDQQEEKGKGEYGRLSATFFYWLSKHRPR